MNRLSILSLGSTRGLWEGPTAEDVQRMGGYAGELEAYVVIASSYKRHKLRPLRLAENFWAIPTDALTAIDGFFRMLAIGWRVLGERRIDVIQAQDPFFTGLAAALLGMRFGKPVNVCVYGPNVYDPHWIANHRLNRIFAPIGRWVLRRVRGIQVDGRMTARSLVAAGHSPESVGVKPVVPSNLERFLAIDRTENAPGGVTRLLYVGRLAPQKNLPLLLTVVQRLKAAGCTAFKLSIIGEGPEDAALRAQAARDDLLTHVEFRGPVSREEVVGVFAAADAFVLTSDFEGFPRVLMEAAAAALPVVSTTVSGADEAIADGTTGYLAPVGDADSLVTALRRLIESAELRQRLGAAAREHVRAKLDPATNTAGQVAIWHRVAAPKAAGEFA
jgi:glycosyltransferase involved in cell wall biosynthesis